MRTRDLYPSKFLQSADAKAKQIVATISSLEVELVGQGQDQKKKPVLRLEGQKPMVLNRTNCETLEDAFGDSNDWPGHKIKIYCVKNAVRGQDGRRAQDRAHRRQAGAQGRSQRRGRALKQLGHRVLEHPVVLSLGHLPCCQFKNVASALSRPATSRSRASARYQRLLVGRQSPSTSTHQQAGATSTPARPTRASALGARRPWILTCATP